MLKFTEIRGRSNSLCKKKKKTPWGFWFRLFWMQDGWCDAKKKKKLTTRWKNLKISCILFCNLFKRTIEKDKTESLLAHIRIHSCTGCFIASLYQPPIFCGLTQALRKLNGPKCQPLQWRCLMSNNLAVLVLQSTQVWMCETFPTWQLKMKTKIQILCLGDLDR